MREGTRQAARDVSTGARALLRHERRPFRASGSRTADRTVRTHVLPSYPSPDALGAAARRQARLARGRTRFVVQSRVLAIGIPLGLAAGVVAWQTGRSSRTRAVAQFIGAFTATLGLTLLEAAAEWRGMEEAEGI